MRRWLLWSTGAVVSWGLWAFIPNLIPELSAPQQQALSTLGLAPVLVVLGLRRRGPAPGSRRRGIAIAFAAGVLSCLGNVAYYHALRSGGKAAAVVAVTNLYPLVSVLGALLFLRERLSPTQAAGIPLSLVAIWLFNVKDTSGLLSGWLAYALIPIALWGVTGLMQKICTFHISGELSTLWFHAAFIPVGGAILLWDPLAGPVPLSTWLLAAGLGLCFGLGNLALLMAFACGGKASVIVPLTGLYPVVSVPLAGGYLGEELAAREWGGIALALAAVVALSWERRSGVAEPRPLPSEGLAA